MLLGALVGRLFGGLLESMHLQVEVLGEKLKRVVRSSCVVRRYVYLGTK